MATYFDPAAVLRYWSALGAADLPRPRRPLKARLLASTIIATMSGADA